MRPRPSRLSRVRRTVVTGLAAVGTYMAVALFVGGAPVGIPLLFDGFGPPVPYRYVDPPPDLAAGNRPPLEASGDVALSEEGSLPTAIGTGDGQMQVIFPGDSFAPREGEELVAVRIAPQAPPASPPPPGELEIEGNAYEVTAAYLESQEDAPLQRDITVVMRYPVHADEMLRLEGSAWVPLDPQRSEPSLQAFADTEELGTFVTARLPETGRWWLPYVVAGAGVLAGIAGYIFGSRRPGRQKKKNGLKRLAATLLVTGLAAASCGTDAPEAAGDRLVIATTVAPITSIVSNVVGDLADVRGLVPEGVDSHTFEPSPSVARTLAEADVIIVNGLGLETPTIDLAQANLAEGAEIVELGPLTITPDEYAFDRDFPEEDGDPNPHLWTNPPFGKRYAEIVAEVMSRRDPGNAGTYEGNLEAFSQRVDHLDQALRLATESVPADNRKLLTYHDAFPYFAVEYGWTILGAIQPSDFSEPSPREVADLIEQIREEGVPAIFGSEVFPSPALERIAEETGAEYVDDLRDDELPGSPGEPEHTYLSMMVFNFRTIVEALGGDPSFFDEVDITDVAPDVASYA